MQVNSTETYSVSNLPISDNANAVSLRIESAHAGIVNGNYIFYTPKALKAGVKSLKEFFRPIQKKHYDKTLGYIYDAFFEQKSESSYLNAIEQAENPTDLVQAVKSYYYSDEYSKNREGFGILVSKAKLYDKDKIKKLSTEDKGHVSIAGGSPSAYCSICSSDVVKCKHKLGNRYDGEVCFAIADDLELDHISFEEIPADWKTKSLIITDSLTLGKVEFIEEGITMFTLEELKEKLQNIENILTELNLSNFLDQYNQDLEKASAGDFLFPKEKLLPLNTKLGVVVATKLLSQLNDGEEKDTVVSIVQKEYTSLLGETSIEDATSQLEVVEVTPEEPTEDTVVDQQIEAPIEPEEKQEEDLVVTDSDKFALSIVDSLSTLVDTKLSELESKINTLLVQDSIQRSNTIYEDRIDALQQDLVIAKTTETTLQTELKGSLLKQIALLKQVDVESEYFKKLESRSIKELKMTLEDHEALQSGLSSVTFEQNTTVVEDTPDLTVQDNQTVVADPVEPTAAVQTMSDDETTGDTTDLTIQDSDAIVNKLVADLGGIRLDKKDYTKLYKSTATEHGVSTAKKLHSVLKQNYLI